MKESDAQRILDLFLAESRERNDKWLRSNQEIVQTLGIKALKTIVSSVGSLAKVRSPKKLRRFVDDSFDRKEAERVKELLKPNSNLHRLLQGAIRNPYADLSEFISSRNRTPFYDLVQGYNRRLLEIGSPLRIVTAGSYQYRLGTLKS